MRIGTNACRGMRAIFVVAVGVRMACAQGPNSTLDALNTLVQRASATHGSRWSSGEIADWTGEGKITLLTPEGPKGTFDVKVMRKGALAVQRIIKQPSGEVKQGSDGAQSWETFGGFFTPSARGMALHFIESLTVRSPQRLFNHGREGLSLRDAGQSSRTQVVEATDPRGKRTSYTIDRDNATVTRLDFVAGRGRDPFSGAEVDVIDSFVFSDYRMVQGALAPFRIERYLNGQKIEEMQFNSVRYNTGLRDQDFRR